MINIDFYKKDDGQCFKKGEVKMNKGIGIIYAVLFIVAISFFVQVIEAIAPIAGVALLISVGAIIAYEIYAISQGVAEQRKLIVALKEKRKALKRSREKSKKQFAETKSEFVQPIEILAYNCDYQQTPALFYVEQQKNEVVTANEKQQTINEENKTEDTPLTSENTSEEYDELDDIIFNNFEEPDVGVPIDLEFSNDEEMYNDSDVSDEDWDEYILSNPDAYQFPDSDDDEFWDMLAEEYLEEEEERLAFERACMESDRLEEEYLESLFEKEYEEEPTLDEKQSEEQSDKFTQTDFSPKGNNESLKTNTEEFVAKTATKQVRKPSIMDKVKETFGKINFDRVKQGITDRASMIVQDAKEHLPQMQQAAKDVISFAITKMKLFLIIAAIIVFSIFLYNDTWSEWLSYGMWLFALLGVTFTIRIILYIVFKQKTKSFTRTVYYKFMKRLN